MSQNQSPYRLDGKVALITGASRGIGFGLAQAFLDAGCDVMLMARDAARLQEARDLLARGTPRVAVSAGDVSVRRDVEEAVQATLRQFGTIDILVNNAAMLGPSGPVWASDPEAWQAAININLVGTYLCCRAVLPIMRPKRRGKIINLSGRGAAFPWPAFSAYGASKAAVVRFTESLAEETRADNIQVNVMAPGANDTELFRQAAEQDPGMLADLPTDPLQPSRLALFLASEASNHITGRFIHVNQGWGEWTAADVAGDRYTLRRVEASPQHRGGHDAS